MEMRQAVKIMAQCCASCSRQRARAPWWTTEVVPPKRADEALNGSADHRFKLYTEGSTCRREVYACVEAPKGSSAISGGRRQHKPYRCKIRAQASAPAGHGFHEPRAMLADVSTI
jgi:NADH:ubiquinone oxidoreductase subunit D